MERVEHTPIGPPMDQMLGDREMTIMCGVPSIVEVSINEMFGAMYEFSDDSSPQQIDEAPGNISTVDGLL